MQLRLAAKSAALALAAIGAALIVLRVAAPWPIYENEEDAALLAAAKAELRQWRQERIYIAFSGRDPSPEQIQELRIELAGKQILTMTERSKQRDRCEPPSPEIIVTGACKEDDFIDIKLQAIPLWGVALVSASTAACGMEYVLAKPAGTWLPVSHRFLCT